MSIESVMPSNHLVLCCPLLFLPSIFPSIRVFSNEPALHIRWPKCRLGFLSLLLCSVTIHLHSLPPFLRSPFQSPLPIPVLLCPLWKFEFLGPFAFLFHSLCLNDLIQSQGFKSRCSPPDNLWIPTHSQTLQVMSLPLTFTLSQQQRQRNQAQLLVSNAVNRIHLGAWDLTFLGQISFRG